MIDLRRETVLGRLPVLAHHDHRSSVGCLEREHQVEQNEWIWIPVVNPGCEVEGDPNSENNALCNDKGPGANRISNPIGNPLTDGLLFLLHFIDVPANHTTQDGIVIAQASAQFHHDVNSSMGMRAEKFKEVIAFQRQCSHTIYRADAR